MASVYKQSSGYTIQIGAGKARRVKRLGKLSRAGAAKRAAPRNPIVETIINRRLGRLSGYMGTATTKAGGAHA